jgi:hypothetical protein
VTQETSGYLVFLKSRDPRELSLTPTYRGIDRTPPYSEVATKSGFADPMIYNPSVGESGLCASAQAASDILQAFTAIYPRDALEIGYVAAAGANAVALRPPAGYTLLGFDVAGTEGPFWSILNDRPSSPEIQQRLTNLNDHGLFRSVREAEAYRNAYSDLRLADWDTPMRVWAVYLPENAHTDHSTSVGR